MSESNSRQIADPGEDILTRFVLDREKALDPEAVLRAYRADYPHLADEFSDFANFGHKVEQSHPEADLPPPAHHPPLP